MRRLQDRLRQRTEALPPIPSDAPSAAAQEWNDNRRDLRRALATEDARGFTAWPMIRKTMFVGDAKFVRQELRELRSLAFPDRSRLGHALVEDRLGAPDRCRWKWRSSSNRIHHLFSYAQFAAAAEVSVSELATIVEFGGGYGSFCRVLHRLGFRGRYGIFDLPEFGLLQEFYLGGLGLEAAFAPPEPTRHRVASFAELDAFSRFLGPAPADLLVALWSLSECPVNLREDFLARTPARRSLFAYQERFGEVDNRAWFTDLAKRRPEYTWRHSPIPHLPGNYYLFATQKA